MVCFEYAADLGLRKLSQTVNFASNQFATVYLKLPLNLQIDTNFMQIFKLQTNGRAHLMQNMIVNSEQIVFFH